MATHPKKVQIKRSSAPNVPPPDGSLLPGELAVETNVPTRLWVGVPVTDDVPGKKLLFDSSMRVEVGAPVVVAEVPPPAPEQGVLWFEADTCILWLYYDDGNTTQWVQVNGLSISGGTGGSGIAEAPADGQLYGRKSLAWHLVPPPGIGEAPVDGTQYARKDSAWDPVITGVTDAYTKAEADAKFADIIGDTFTGQLIVKYNTPQFRLDSTAAGQARNILGSTNGSMRWALQMGDASAEGGTGNGSNFAIQRYNDAGAHIGAAFTIDRQTGIGNFYNTININGSANAGYFSCTGNPITYLTATAGDSLLFFRSTPGSECYFQCNHATLELRCAVAGLTGFTINASAAFIAAGQAYKPGGGLWVASSDERIKNVLGDYTAGLDMIKQLQPRRFTYKGNDVSVGAVMPEKVFEQGEIGSANEFSNHYKAAIDGTEYIGLVAQEAEVVAPELVTMTSSLIDGLEVADMRELDTTPLLFALINAVKQLSAEIDALKAAR